MLFTSKFYLRKGWKWLLTGLNGVFFEDLYQWRQVDNILESLLAFFFSAARFWILCSIRWILCSIRCILSSKVCIVVIRWWYYELIMVSDSLHAKKRFECLLIVRSRALVACHWNWKDKVRERQKHEATNQKLTKGGASGGTCGFWNWRQIKVHGSLQFPAISLNSSGPIHLSCFSRASGWPGRGGWVGIFSKIFDFRPCHVCSEAGFGLASAGGPAADDGPTMLFKTHFKRNLRLANRITGIEAIEVIQNLSHTWETLLESAWAVIVTLIKRSPWCQNNAIKFVSSTGLAEEAKWHFSHLRNSLAV